MVAGKTRSNQQKLRFFATRLDANGQKSQNILPNGDDFRMIYHGTKQKKTPYPP